MSGKTGGWRIRQRKAGKAWTVVFWSPWEKCQKEFSTYELEPKEAKKAAKKLYIEYLDNEPQVPKSFVSLEDTAVKYLEETKNNYRPIYLKGLTYYYEQWAQVFPDLSEITREKVIDWTQGQLKIIKAVSIRKKIRALNRLAKWAADKKLIKAVEIPLPARSAEGTPFPTRRTAAAVVSADEIEQILALLPETTFIPKGHQTIPLRPRYRLMWELALRPETVAKLSVPQHWNPENPQYLTLTPDVMKLKKPSRKVLTPKALEAIKAVYSGQPGLLFGPHALNRRVKAAAYQVLDKERAKRFCGQWLRSARLSHLSLLGVPPKSVQTFADHANLSQTSIYLRESDRDLINSLQTAGIL